MSDQNCVSICFQIYICQSANSQISSNKGSSANHLDIAATTARALAAQIVRIPCRRNEDAGEAEEGLAGVAVAGVHGQGVAGDPRDVEVGDAVGVSLAGVAAVVGVAEPDEVGVEALAVVDHRLG